MDELRETSGYQEVDHTADWALRVWAPDFYGLLIQAALGMRALLGGVIQPKDVHREVSIHGDDAEMVLVSFLSDILYLNVQENLAFEKISIDLQGNDMTAHLYGGRLTGQTKEIKAVTYHNLAVLKTPKGVETTIVFDV